MNLKPFCSTDDTRPSINEPWSIGETTYATDGRVIVRVPKREDVPENLLGPPDAPGLWKKLPPIESITAWERLPVFPEPQFQVCSYCGGDAPLCEECDYTGQEKVRLRVILGNKGFSNHYLALIAMLPDLWIAPTITKEMEQMPFKFDGGDGLLMPLKDSYVPNWKPGYPMPTPQPSSPPPKTPAP